MKAPKSLCADKQVTASACRVCGGPLVLILSALRLVYRLLKHGWRSTKVGCPQQLGGDALRAILGRDWWHTIGPPQHPTRPPNAARAGGVSNAELANDEPHSAWASASRPGRRRLVQVRSQPPLQRDCKRVPWTLTLTHARRSRGRHAESHVKYEWHRLEDAEGRQQGPCGEVRLRIVAERIRGGHQGNAHSPAALCTCSHHCTGPAVEPWKPDGRGNACPFAQDLLAVLNHIVTTLGDARLHDDLHPGASRFLRAQLLKENRDYRPSNGTAWTL